MKVNDDAGCKPINIPNCLNEDMVEKKCIWCQNSFTPNPKDGEKTCQSCSVINPLCTHCRDKTADETSNNAFDLVCTGCPSRYVLNQTEGTCIACTPHCTYCGLDNTCYSCDAGYQLKDNKCNKVSLPNCDVPAMDKGCASCQSGYFLNSTENTCDKCHDSCLMCDGPKEENCSSCSISKYSLRIEDDNPFLSFFGSTKLRCVEKCPADFNGKSYVEHDLTRECVAQTEKDSRPKTKYPFTRHTSGKTWETIYHDSEDFHSDYLKHAKHSVESAKHWARLHPKEAIKYSHQCHFRGELVEKISSSRETYYHCECMHNMHGPDCEVDKSLYQAIQSHVEAVSKDMMELQSTMKEDLFAKAIINLCQAPLSLDSVSTLIKTSTDLLEKKHFIVKDVPQMLSVVDYLAKAFYKGKTELEHRADGYERDIGYQDFLSVMYKQFHDLINIGDTVFRDSAPYQSFVVDASTHTFQVTDHIATSQTFDDTEFINVLSPNLLGMTELMAPLTIYISNEYLRKNHNNRTRLVAWAYSRHLFPPDRKYASHLAFIYPMEVINEKAVFHPVKFEDEDVVTIKFPIKVLPPSVDIKRTLRCAAFHFSEDDHVADEKPGEMVGHGAFEDTARPYVVCKYRKMLAGYYFSVVFNDVEIPHMHVVKTAKALTMEINHHLQVTLDTKPKYQSGMILGLKMVALVICALFMTI